MKVPFRLLDTRFARNMSLRWKDRLDGTIPNRAEISPAGNPRGPAAASTRKMDNRERWAMALKASILLSSSIFIADPLSTVVCPADLSYCVPSAARMLRKPRGALELTNSLAWGRPQAIHPPSTVRLSPLVKLASVLARYDTAAAISS